MMQSRNAILYGMQRLPAVALLASMLALGACTGLSRLDRPFDATDGDYADIAAHSLKYIEMRGPVERFVVGDDIEPRVRNALKRERPVRAAAAGLSADASVPPGTFVLTGFTIADGEASFEGTLGTRRGDAPCNLKFSIPWYLGKENEWWNPSYKIESCDRREDLAP